MAQPRVALMARNGEALSDLQAAAGKLWLGYGGKGQDEDGAVARAIAAHWAAQDGDDPYWDFLAGRAACDECGETYKYENLAICPNCFSAACYKHARTCRCGFERLG